MGWGHRTVAGEPEVTSARADARTQKPASKGYERASTGFARRTKSEGSVITGFAGGCLWVADPDADGTTEAVAIGASIKLTTHFTGVAQ